MKTKLMIALCSAAMFLSGCATSHSHATAWEYKTLHAYVPADIEKQLNQLASEGWIVVSSSSAAEGNNTPAVLVILKRHK
jgi:outer membrane lipoprotein-sorting protein